MDFDLKLVTIDDAYIDYLLQYEIDVMPNRKEKSKHTRLYLSLMIDGVYHQIPLSSPCEGDYYHGGAKKDAITIIRLVDKNTDLLGTLRLSHMIIAPVNAIKYYDIKRERDLRYRELVTKEYLRIKAKQDRIRKNANVLIKQKAHEDDFFLYSNHDAPAYLSKTLDFAFIKSLSGEYAPGLNNDYGYVAKEYVEEEVLKPALDEMNFAMLDRVLPNPINYHEEEKVFSIEEERSNLRQMMMDNQEEEKREQLFVSKPRLLDDEPTPIKEEINVDVSKNEDKAIKEANPIVEESRPIAEEEIRSTKTMLVAFKSILSGNSSPEIIEGSYFRYKNIIYCIYKYDPRSLIGLIKNTKTGDFFVVSDFPRDAECGWNRPVKIGSEADALQRGLKIYEGFIK